MSEVLDPPLTHPVTAALDALTEAMASLTAVASSDTTGQLWTRSSAELLDDTAGLHRLVNQADAVLHAMVREVDVRGAATEVGAATTAAWLRHRLRLHPATAKRLVETARAIHDDPAGPLVPDGAPGSAAPAGRGLLRAAFGRGDMSAEHAQVATRTLAELPPVDADTADRAAAFLVEQARTYDPKALSHLGRHLRHLLDPDAGDQLALGEEHATATQILDIREAKDGGSRVSGRLGPELTAALRGALSPLAAPRPTVDGIRDQRAVGLRQADALAELLRRYAGAECGPGVHGAPAAVTVTMPLDTLQHRLGAPAATLDWSGPVSAATARRLACDARIIPVLLGGNGEPLDVGRSTYPVTQAIWRALVARDRGCAFASCDRPPDWCDAHHLTHWADGGATSVRNCALLCSFHHRAVHHHGWDLQLVDDRIVTIPPPWVDPTRTPRLHTGPLHLPDRLSQIDAPDDD